MFGELWIWDLGLGGMDFSWFFDGQDDGEVWYNLRDGFY